LTREPQWMTGCLQRSTCSQLRMRTFKMSIDKKLARRKNTSKTTRSFLLHCCVWIPTSQARMMRAEESNDTRASMHDQQQKTLPNHMLNCNNWKKRDQPVQSKPREEKRDTVTIFLQRHEVTISSSRMQLSPQYHAHSRLESLHHCTSNAIGISKRSKTNDVMNRFKSASGNAEMILVPAYA
jgi:hypothetical protein